MADELEDYWKDILPGYRGGRSRAAWLVGRVYGRLTVIERAGSDKHGASTWKCRCECGNEKVVRRGALLQGRVKSCGCLLVEYRSSTKPWLKGPEKPKLDDDAEEYAEDRYPSVHPLNHPLDFDDD